MYLRDLLDIGEYNRLVDQGYINVRKHPEYDLYISNYSKEAQFKQYWTRPVMLSRGLITDDNDKIIARPWAKFFNLGEKNMEIQPTDPCEVMDKVDGSLGILYPTPDGTYAIATRGSFDSDQARHASEVWKNKYAAYHDATLHDARSFTGQCTFLFEIIYKGNRIVLDYGDMDDLMLLGAVGTETGYYYGPREAAAFLGWTGPVVEVMDFNTISDALSHTNRENAEGFVIRSHNYMVKIKQPDYLDMHRLKFNMNPKRVWEILQSDTDINDVIAILPDEFHKEILDVASDLSRLYVNLQNEVYLSYEKVEKKNPQNPREFAELALQEKYPAPLFTLKQGAKINDWIWKQIKPKGNKSDYYADTY